MNQPETCEISQTAAGGKVDELAMLVRQLVHTLRKASPSNDLADRALDYLKRHGLAGTFLRGNSAFVPDDVPVGMKPSMASEGVGTSASASHPENVPAPAAVAWSMPAEPTEQMIEVLMAGEDRLRARHGDDLPKQRAKDRYRALLALAATQAAAPVVQPEPVGAEKETQAVMQLVADYTHKAVLESSGNYPEITLAQMNEAWSAIFGKVRALLATATGLPAQQVEMPDFDLRTSKGGRGFVAWYFANVLQRYDYENYITNKLAADFACDLAKALSSTLAAPQAQADARAAELLGFLQDQCIDLRCFTTSDGEDVGWRTVQHHMDKPHERVVSEVCSDDPRRAIREAMARIERDPYCTGPLHLEDDAAIAAAKGE